MWMKFAGRYGKPSDNAGGASRASLRLFSAGVGELLTSTEYKLKQNTLKNFLIRLTHTHTHTRKRAVEEEELQVLLERSPTLLTQRSMS